MIHEWNQLTFVHWSAPVDAVQRLLPPGLTVEPFDGAAWIGLVPFMMHVKAGRGPYLPWLSQFCETNVRTYVRAPDGTTGVWFLSLDAARLPAVIAGRSTYAMPYYWSRMDLLNTGSDLTYRCERRWPGDGHQTSLVRVRIGARFSPSELNEFDHYLTARWRLYGWRGRTLRSADAQHPPWELHRATLTELDDQLIGASGLPQPTGEPIVHWSPGTRVRIGFPHTLPRPQL